MPFLTQHHSFSLKYFELTCARDYFWAWCVYIEAWLRPKCSCICKISESVAATYFHVHFFLYFLSRGLYEVYTFNMLNRKCFFRNIFFHFFGWEREWTLWTALSTLWTKPQQHTAHRFKARIYSIARILNCERAFFVCECELDENFFSLWDWDDAEPKHMVIFIS